MATFDNGNDVQSFGTISDRKSHKADATWASLFKFSNHINLS